MSFTHILKQIYNKNDNPDRQQNDPEIIGLIAQNNANYEPTPCEKVFYS